MIQIIPTCTGTLLESFIALSYEYVRWMVAEIQNHYPALDIAAFTADHDYDDISRKFPGNHVPPDGCLLVALKNDCPVGCVAIGRLNEQVCELRTLFVQPAYHGLGIGKKLVEVALHEAYQLQYAYVRLDTLGFMVRARTMYRSFGFYDIEPYRTIPDSWRHYIHFFEHHIADRATR